MKALVSSNPDLKEICTDTWEGGVKVSKKDKSTLKKKGIRHHEEDTIPDSDIESEEEDEVDDEGDSGEDSDSSGGMENSESSEEESSEDEIEGGIEEHSADEADIEGSEADIVVGEADIEGSEGGANFSGEETSSIWLRIAFFALLSLVCYLRLYGNYFFGNLS